MRVKDVAPLTLVAVGVLAAIGRAQEVVPPAPTLKPRAGLAQKPNTFGTSQTVFVTIPEWQFAPAGSDVTYSDTGSNQPMRFATSSNAVFFASPALPSGALLQSLEFDYCNNQPPGGQPIQLYISGLDYQNHVIQFFPTLTGNPGDGCSLVSEDLSSWGFTFNNNLNRVIMELVFGNNADATTTFQGAIVGYKLQVSPAPPTPTFGDVPTSDFGFQYIEALSASGITGGCGGGNFCPDNPVTRRQMAIFIAKALGLSYN